LSKKRGGNKKRDFLSDSKLNEYQREKMMKKNEFLKEKFGALEFSDVCPNLLRKQIEDLQFYYNENNE
jgi:hypothetical protein